MVYTPRHEDLIDAPELTGEQTHEVTPDTMDLPPEVLATLGEHANKNVAEGMMANEKTPDELEKIASLEHDIASRGTSEQEIISEKVGEEVVQVESEEIMEAKAELEEYLAEANTAIPDASLEEKFQYVTKSQNKKLSATMGNSEVSKAGNVAGAAGMALICVGFYFQSAYVVLGGLTSLSLAGLSLASLGSYWVSKKLWNNYKEFKARKNSLVASGEEYTAMGIMGDIRSSHKEIKNAKKQDLNDIAGKIDDLN